MNFKKSICFPATILGLALFPSCDWTGGSDSDFNTSRGNLNINISGVYSGLLSGGRAVSQTTGGAIRNFVIQQSGNVVEITDSNAQKYRGSVGSPLALAQPTSGGVIPVGAQLASFQVNWAGKDGVAAKNIKFTGVINLVSVTDIRGNTTATTQSSNSSSQNTTDSTSERVRGNETTTENATSAETTEGIEGTQTVVIGPGGQTAQEVFSNINSSSSSTNTSTVNGNNSSSTSSAATANGQARTSNATTSSQFALNDSNVKFRLRGSWIEEGGVVGTVDCIAPGAGGVLVVVNTGETSGGGQTGADAFGNLP